MFAFFQFLTDLVVVCPARASTLVIFIGIDDTTDISVTEFILAFLTCLSVRGPERQAWIGLRIQILVRNRWIISVQMVSMTLICITGLISHVDPD